MLAIYKKEMKSYFHSMLGWLFLAVNIFFSAWYFRYYSIMQGYPYISYVISGILLIFLFSIPILTMRSFAEEMRNKTDQLLFTAPVSLWKVVLGKYLALATIFFVAVFVIGLFPLVLRIFGPVPMGENYLALLGFLLFGLTCLAIGELISALFENPIIAAVITFFVLLLGVLISGISEMISLNGNWLTSLLSILDLTAYMDYCLYGKLYLPSFLYYFSYIALCLYFTVLTLSKKRWRVATHGIMKLVGSVSGSAVIVLLVVACNMGIKMLPEEFTMRDLTYNQIYSLSSAAEEMLQTLDEPIHIYVLTDQSNIDETLDSTLHLIAEESSFVTYEYISPSDNPYFYTQYTDKQPTDNSLIITKGETYVVLDYIDCYEFSYEYGIDYTTGSYQVTDYQVTGYDGEGKILGAIKQLNAENTPKIYNIVGHDEIGIDESLQSEMTKANYAVESINLLTYDQIPADAEVVFVLGPLSDFSVEDTRKLQEYLDRGGKAICVIAYTDAEELENYYSLFTPYGVEVCPGLVMEVGTSYYNAYEYYLLPEIVSTDITKGIYSTMRNKYIYMPYAKGVHLEPVPAVTSEVFLKTTDHAYTMTDFSEAGLTEPGALGPFALGVYLERIASTATSSMVLFTSDYLLDSNINQVVNGNNYSLFMNALNKLTGQENQSVIPVKAYSYAPIVMNQIARTIVSYLLIGILPIGLTLAGGHIWYHRRKR